MSKLKLGLIGCGGMMNHHVNGLLGFEDAEIVAVADVRPERVEAMKTKTGAARGYASHKEFFAGEDKIDALYIAVEPTAHDEIEETAIERNWPFLVEKPMTLDMNQAKAISEAVTAKKLVTCVGFQDRYLDIIDRMKEELATMQTGMVYGSWLGGVPPVWWWMKKETCGGQLMEQNIHLVDMLRYLFGEAKSVFATYNRGLVSPKEFDGRDLPTYETDDYSSAMITFESGLTANLMTGCFITREGHPIRNGLTAIGRDMSIEYELRTDLRIYTADGMMKFNRMKDQSIAHDRAFLDAVKAGDPTAVRSPYPDAYKSLLLAHAANESMDTGKVVML
jgi:predicted dehydrogenase